MAVPLAAWITAPIVHFVTVKAQLISQYPESAYAHGQNPVLINFAKHTQPSGTPPALLAVLSWLPRGESRMVK
jgi:hypothetical protein